MKSYLIDHDIYDRCGTLLITKGTQIILSEERKRQLERLGIFDEVMGHINKEHNQLLFDHPPIEDEVKCHRENDDYFLSEAFRLEFQATLDAIDEKLHGVESSVMHLTTEALSNILFNSHDEEWFKYIQIQLHYKKSLYAHALNTAIIACIIATTLGYRDDSLEAIGIGAMLHDIGVTLFPEEVLMKYPYLDKNEELLMQSHCNLGYSMIKNTSLPHISKKMVQQHHERIDGTGYPNFLTSRDILPESKILIVAEYFDSQTTALINLSPHTIAETVEDMARHRISFPVDVLNALKENIVYYE